MNADGTQVISGSDDKTARITALTGGVKRPPYEAGGSVRKAAFSRDGKKVVIGVENGPFCILDLATNSKECRDPSGLVSVAFSPDGAAVLTGTHENLAILWPAESMRQQPLLQLKGHDDWVFHASFSRDGSKIVTTSKDNTARLWSVEHTRDAWALKQPPVVLPHPDRVMNAAFSSDGLLVATACADKEARLWKTDGTTVPLREFPHLSDVFSVAISSDGKWLLTASDDQTAKVWFIDNGDEFLSLNHGWAVRSAVFGPGDTSVITGADDGNVRLWHLGAQDLAQYMSQASTACLTLQERVRYLGESTDTAASGYRACEVEHKRTDPAFGLPSTR